MRMVIRACWGWGRTQGLLAMHDVTGSPWWLTIVGTTVLLRTALLPLTLRGMRAAADNQPLIAHCFGGCCCPQALRM